ncbi:Uncharacterised protein [Sphingobacterium spiritivorum]|nr:Uncharacterised protein [Sphingobacterium spiritivorum]
MNDHTNIQGFIFLVIPVFMILTPAPVIFTDRSPGFAEFLPVLIYSLFPGNTFYPTFDSNNNT